MSEPAIWIALPGLKDSSQRQFADTARPKVAQNGTSFWAAAQISLFVKT